MVCPGRGKALVAAVSSILLAGARFPVDTGGTNTIVSKARQSDCVFPAVISLDGAVTWHKAVAGFFLLVDVACYNCVTALVCEGNNA